MIRLAITSERGADLAEQRPLTGQRRVGTLEDRDGPDRRDRTDDLGSGEWAQCVDREDADPRSSALADVVRERDERLQCRPLRDEQDLGPTPAMQAGSGEFPCRAARATDTFSAAASPTTTRHARPCSVTSRVSY